MAAPLAKLVQAPVFRRISTRIRTRRRPHDFQNIAKETKACTSNKYTRHCDLLCQRQWMRESSNICSIQTSQYCTVPHRERHCWKCNSKTDAKTELFFCNCGVVQSVPSDLTFFKAMNLEERFDINLDHLSQLYKDLQRLLHPDKYSQKSKDEQDLAEKQSAFVNKAYNTLLKPLSRGLYLLEIKGIPLEDTENFVDSELLLEVMETNEDLAEAEGNDAAVSELEKINQSRIKLCIRQIVEHFRADDLIEAKHVLVRLRYFTNIEEKIKNMHRKKMDH